MSSGSVATEVVDLRSAAPRALDGGPREPDPPAEVGGRRSWSPGRVGLVVLLCGLLLTTVLSVGTWVLRDSNENRLLRQQVHEAATVITAAVPNTQGPLLSAATLAETTGGDAASFRALMQPNVSTGRPFVSASLWSTRAGSSKPLLVVGTAPELATQSPAVVRAYLKRATGQGTMTINDMLGSTDRRLGYGYSVKSGGAQYVVYGEAVLPKERQANVASNSAFNNFDYAIYLGEEIDSEKLIASSVPSAELPLRGRVKSESVAFGNQRLNLVLKPKGDLGGGFLHTLPWGFLIVGTLLSIGAAMLAGRLARRRQEAEALAAENARLFAQQQTVAQTLQHSLLPEVLPDVRGTEFGVRYIAGVEDVEIGGDWYDVVALDERRVLFVVGDVSGRGLRAAAVMASLRFGARAYAAQGDPPHVILSKLSQLLNVNRDDHFATVLCGVLDFDARKLVISDAGHPPPLLLGDGVATFVDVEISPPIGTRDDLTYTSTETSIPASGTLLAFTDGLIERRGQVLDVGFERLRQSAMDGPSSLEGLLDHVVANLVQDGADDDTALLGASWN